MLVRWRDGDRLDVTPPGSNVRTSVHEYGGGAWWVHDGVVFYVDFDDQRLRRIEAGGEPVLLSPEPDEARALRFADGRVTPDGRWFVCVHEQHGADRTEAVNSLVAVATDGSMEMRPGGERRRLLCVAPAFAGRSTRRLDPVDAPEHAVGLDRTLAGRPRGRRASNAAASPGTATRRCSSPSGTPTARSPSSPIAPTGGTSTTSTSQPASCHTGRVPTTTSSSRTGSSAARGTPGTITSSAARTVTDWPRSSISRTRRSRRCASRATPCSSSAHRSGGRARSCDCEGRDVEVLRPARDLGLDAEFLPTPEFITFPTTDGDQAHGLYYAPAHPHVELPPGERPPLVVFIHGGPTAAAAREYAARLGHRYWTSRGSPSSTSTTAEAPGTGGDTGTCCAATGAVPTSTMPWPRRSSSPSAATSTAIAS